MPIFLDMPLANICDIIFSSIFCDLLFSDGDLNYRFLKCSSAFIDAPCKCRAINEAFKKFVLRLI
jgi:hypothetical protein